VLSQTLSVVIPVFRASDGLAATLQELTADAGPIVLSAGAQLVLQEIVLVCDNPALPAAERTRLLDHARRDPRVRVVWLSSNFGQHPATVAGVVSTNGDWVLTMDEDGQHDPAAIPQLALAAADAGASLVYARPSNPPPHGALRNASSRAAKALFRRLTGTTSTFHSFRLVEGEVARSACAYVGESVYLDVALRWSCGEAAHVPVPMRAESSPSVYNVRKLVSHFWRMVVSSGTRPLRMIAALGISLAVVGVLAAAVLVLSRLTGAILVPGWTSVMVALLVLVGGVLLSLAILAEYVAFAVRNTIGKPVYVTVQAPDQRALWRLQAALAAAE
jgi:glycosyltransferase involved in cell wall biosynthesis